MEGLLSPSTSARGPPRAVSPCFGRDENAPSWRPNAEGKVNENLRPETRRTVEVRCPDRRCGCTPRGKLLATLIDFPAEVFGSGAVLQVACPNKKSRLVRIRL